MNIFDGQRVLVTGGTGSLGTTLVRRLLSGAAGLPEAVVIFSRDEAKQHQMRLDFHNRPNDTDEIVYQNFKRRLQFRIGDVRDYSSVCMALQNIDIVINAAALKQVPTCEYFPFEAVQTNVIGPQNILTAISRERLPVKVVVGVSTDKAALPINVMGMTKALQERIMVSSQLGLPNTRILIVRYGNVAASRGSVIPLFRQQIQAGGPLTITDPRMTRFLFTLDHAVDAICAAIEGGQPGETYVPRAKAARIVDVAAALIGDRSIRTEITGIRPGEKIHEVLISYEESSRARRRGSYFVLSPMLPELATSSSSTDELWEYSSGAEPLSAEMTRKLLEDYGLLGSSPEPREQELLC